jgi:hypothetical protein
MNTIIIYIKLLLYKELKNKDKELKMKVSVTQI